MKLKKFLNLYDSLGDKVQINDSDLNMITIDTGLNILERWHELHGCKMVDENIGEFWKILDGGFFRVRYERCSEAEKRFVFAMVACGELPCTISNVAKIMKKTVGSVSTSRAKLISKGIVYAVRHKELDFTVPEFDRYISRLGEYHEWVHDQK